MSRQRVVQLTIDVHQSLLRLIHPHTVCPDIILLARRNVLFRSNRCSYFSIVVMIVSNYGVFATSFTEETCQKYYFVSPVFKGLSYLAFTH